MSSELLIDKQNQHLEVIQKTGNEKGLSFITKIQTYTKIRNYDVELLKSSIGSCFAKISLLNGFKNEIQIINKVDIMEMLLSKYKNISIEEINEAFRMERYGELGERVNHFQLFNAEYVSKVLDLYKNWLQDTKIKKNIVPEQKKMEDITEQEKKTIIYLGIMDCWDNYIKGNGIIDGYSWVYDWFFERKAFPKHTPEYKIEINKRANKKLEQIWSINPKTMSVKKYVSDLKGSGKIGVICKKIILSDLFDNYSTGPLSIVDILKGLENKK
jgi:hypothetical protein